MDAAGHRGDPSTRSRQRPRRHDPAVSYVLRGVSLRPGRAHEPGPGRGAMTGVRHAATDGPLLAAIVATASDEDHRGLARLLRRALTEIDRTSGGSAPGELRPESALTA